MARLLNYIVVPSKISIWGNDDYGDCVTAEEAFAKSCNNPEIFIENSEAVSWATRHNALNGAVISEVLQWMQTDGFKQDSLTYNDGSHSTVNWTNASILRSAVSQGPVKIGVAADQLETVYNGADRKSGWFATGFHADATEDHCVSLCGYGTIGWLAQELHVAVPNGIDATNPGYALFTWNSIGIIDESSLVAITHEAWLRTPTSIVSSPDGIGTLAFVKTANTPSGKVEVHLASGASGYQTRTLETATTFGIESDGVWQVLPNQDLVFIKTSNTPSGKVEVHIASRSSNYQSRVLETSTTFGNETDGVWQLLLNLDLAFIKTSGTPDGHVEVHIASRASNYQNRTVETSSAFANESDGVWQFLPNLDLAFIKTSGTPSGRVEVHIASRASNYQTRILETATTFIDESDGVWQLLPNLDLAFIKTSNTPNGHVEVHVASRASGYQSRTLEVSTTFGNESDGTWNLLLP